MTARRQNVTARQREDLSMQTGTLTSGQSHRIDRNPSDAHIKGSNEGHRRIVREQFVRLHDVFDQCRPSESLRAIFDQTVGLQIRRRIEDSQAAVRILEVGCGVGNWAEHIYATFSDSASRVFYRGIDVAEPCAASCNRRLAGHPTGRAEVADYESLPANAPCDILLFVEVFCHLRRGQDAAWLRKARELLAPGGCIVIIDKERSSRHGRKVKWDLFKRRWLPAALRGRPYYFPDTYNELLTTLRYPSFPFLSRELNDLSISAQPIVEHGLFSAVVGCRPGAQQENGPPSSN